MFVHTKCYREEGDVDVHRGIAPEYILRPRFLNETIFPHNDYFAHREALSPFTPLASRFPEYICLLCNSILSLS